MNDFVTISRVLWEPSDIIEIRPLPTDKAKRRWIKAGEAEKIINELEADNRGKANLYAGVLPRVAGGGECKDCLPGLAAWADIDGGCSPRDAWKRAKTNGLPDPSVVVNSGHGAHLYWLLKEKATPQQLTGLVADIITVLGSDKSVKDAARIMRMPGFTNWKEPVAQAKIEYMGPARYTFEQLRGLIVLPCQQEAFVQTEAGSVIARQDSMVERARRYIATIPGQGKGGRTATAYRVAAVIKDFGLTEGEALELLRGWDSAANRPPIEGDPAYQPGELGRIVRHAYRYGIKPPGAKADQAPAYRGPKEEPAPEIPPDGCNQDVLTLMDEIDLQEQGKRTSIQLPWRSLNNLAKPLRPGSVCLVAGPIKVGKSYLLLNMALHCHRLGVPWRYLPLEDAWKDFGFRVLACIENNYDMTDDVPETANLRREALIRSGPYLEDVMRNVNDNPRLGKKDAAGNTVIPPVYYQTVVEWARNAMKKARIIFIDPLSQIDAKTEKHWNEESQFIRALLAIANDTQGTIVLSGHTSKRPGPAAKFDLTAEDVQGSAMLTRLCHTVLVLNGHDKKESTVVDSYGSRRLEQFNRTLYIAAARNGSGTRTKLAYTQNVNGPQFEEHGIIIKDNEK